MKHSRGILLAAAIVCLPAMLKAEDVRTVKSFRGVIPGETTRQELLKDEPWGKPVRSAKKNGLEEFIFKIRPWERVIAVVQNGLVRAMEFVPPPEHALPETLAAAIGFGKLLPSESLPLEARIERRDIGRGSLLRAEKVHVVMLVEGTGGQARAKLIRFYTPWPVSALRGPSATAREAVKAAAAVLPKHHISHKPLDDAMSQRWLEQFLKRLDPEKRVLTQGEVDRFKQRGNDLDDMARRGDLDFAYEMFRTFLARFEERARLAHELLEEEYDFTVDEQMQNPASRTEYPAGEAEMRALWRKHVKYGLLLETLDGTDLQEARAKLARRYDLIVDQWRQIDDDALLESYLSALAAAYDPGSRYMAKNSWITFTSDIQRELMGIGAQLKWQEGYTVVTWLVPGGAAARDGRLQPGDKIVGVGQGEAGAIQDVAGMRLTDVVKQIRGEKGTVVRLQVRRPTQPQPLVLNITRDRIQFVGARGKLFSQAGSAGKQPVRIGYIYLPKFYGPVSTGGPSSSKVAGCSADIRRLIEAPDTGFKAAGADVLVVDLRTNTGGTLAEVLRAADLFLDTGAIAIGKDSSGKQNRYEAKQGTTIWRKPLVLLTTKYTSGMAEIFAAAMQDHQRGLVVGSRNTAGHGAMQQVIDVARRLSSEEKEAAKLGILQITTFQVFRPTGISLEDHNGQRGIAADVELPWLVASEVPRATASHFGLAAAARRALSLRSQRRRSAVPYFQELARNIEQYRRYYDPDYVSLNAERLRASREAVSGDAAKVTRLDRQIATDDPFLNEAFHVAADYLALGDQSPPPAPTPFDAPPPPPPPPAPAP